MRTLPALLACSVLTLVACGGEPGSAGPTDPDALLARVRAAAAADEHEAVAAHLEAWPTDDEAFEGTAATQVALTWRIRLALEAGRVEAALSDVDALEARFDGGRTPEGHELGVDLLRRGIADAAIESAVEAPVDDPRARARLDAVAPFADPERLDAARRWLDLRQASVEGPAVLAWVDAFALGEPILGSVLRRWSRDHRGDDLAVVVVPTRLDVLRVGMRRTPADAQAALAALAARAAELGLELGVPFAEDDERRGLLAALDRDVAVLVVDRRGRVVARRAGRGVVDPRSLESDVQRVATR